MVILRYLNNTSWLPPWQVFQIIVYFWIIVKYFSLFLPFIALLLCLLMSLYCWTHCILLIRIISQEHPGKFGQCGKYVTILCPRNLRGVGFGGCCWRLVGVIRETLIPIWLFLVDWLIWGHFAWSIVANPQVTSISGHSLSTIYWSAICSFISSHPICA